MECAVCVIFIKDLRWWWSEWSVCKQFIYVCANSTENWSQKIFPVQIGIRNRIHTYVIMKINEQKKKIIKNLSFSQLKYKIFE